MLDVLLGRSARSWTERAQTSPWPASWILKKKNKQKRHNTREVATQEMLGVTQNTHSPKLNTCAQTHPRCTRCGCTEPWCPQQSPCCAPTPCLICPADHVNSRVEEGAMTSTGGGRGAVWARRGQRVSKVLVLKINLKKLYIPVRCVSRYGKHTDAPEKKTQRHRIF